MDAKTWQRVKEIFGEAVALDAAGRADFLDRKINGDESLRSEVDALLRSHDEAENFIEEPAFSFADALPAAADPITGKVVGHYRVIRELGRGGMGAVFLAKRDDGEFQQDVAIKVVSSALLGRASLERFRQERQILARLNHPNIARLIDGGVTDDGIPYLVMEYVEGDTLVDYVDNRGLSVNERLRIFLKICRAFAYAHGSLIVHRDIKPSNILVTPDGEPKLLDFGLAKMLDLQSGEIRTATNFRALTPAYASPEQIRGDVITTASDIYSLGVVLYEMLTGTRPIDYEAMTFERMVDMASHTEPERPSLRLRHLSAQGPGKKARQNRQSRSQAGDIDNIVLMAMRSDPERRYRSVEQMANDIERHLTGLPIVASKPTYSYRASKFIRRHRVGAAAAAVIILSLVAGIIATAWQAGVARQERDTARIEKEKAEQLNAFLQSILSAASPESMGKDARVIDVINDAAIRLDSELAGQPELKARALVTIADTYVRLGQPAVAEGKLREAIAIYQTQLPHVGLDAVRAQKLLAECLIGQYKFDEAAAILNSVIEEERFIGDPARQDLAEALFALGELRVRQGNYPQAEALLTESIALCDAGGEEQRFQCAYARISLGRSRQFAGDVISAERIFRESLAVFETDPAHYSTRIADISVNLGDLLLNKGDTPGSIALLSKADAIYEKEVGESFQLAISKYYLARAHLAASDNAAASELARRSVEMAKKLNWTSNRNFYGALALYGAAVSRLGRAAEGERSLREALKRAEGEPAPSNPVLGSIRGYLGECLLAQNRTNEAAPLLRARYDTFLATFGEHDQRTIDAAVRLATLSK